MPTVGILYEIKTAIDICHHMSIKERTEMPHQEDGRDSNRRWVADNFVSQPSESTEKLWVESRCISWMRACARPLNPIFLPCPMKSPRGKSFDHVVLHWGHHCGLDCGFDELCWVVSKSNVVSRYSKSPVWVSFSATSELPWSSGVWWFASHARIALTFHNQRMKRVLVRNLSLETQNRQRGSNVPDSLSWDWIAISDGPEQ
jgi:hypothetical protein